MEEERLFQEFLIPKLWVQSGTLQGNIAVSAALDCYLKASGLVQHLQIIFHVFVHLTDTQILVVCA